eukprot:348910-Pyramimonas_sp.AAC.1
MDMTMETFPADDVAFDPQAYKPAIAKMDKVSISERNLKTLTLVYRLFFTQKPRTFRHAPASVFSSVSIHKSILPLNMAYGPTAATT